MDGVLEPALAPDTGRSRTDARLALAALVAGIIACLTVSATQATRPVETRPGDTDVDLFRKVVVRVHAGESPNDAFEHVFREYHYPVRSFLNYRMPLHAWVLGRLPSPQWGQALLGLIILTTALEAYTVMRREGKALAVVGVVVMIGVLAYGFLGEMFLYTEVWSGTLIAMSVCAYALGRPWLGWSAGLLALFVRELTLPYVLVCLALALRRDRRREATAWAIGLGLFGLYFGAHVLAVAPRIPPEAGGIVNGSGWVRCGGLAFILATCRVNLLLLASSPTLAAFFLPLSLFGLWTTWDENRPARRADRRSLSGSLLPRRRDVPCLLGLDVRRLAAVRVRSRPGGAPRDRRHCVPVMWVRGRGKSCRVRRVFDDAPLLSYVRKRCVVEDSTHPT